MTQRYWIETLGCPKNEVDSDKLAGTLQADGLELAGSPESADLVVVNTCAFVEAARQESLDTVLELDAVRRGDSRLVVTGCLAERYQGELEAALPEIDLVAPFGVRLTRPGRSARFDLAHARLSRREDPVGGPSQPTPVALGRKPARRGPPQSSLPITDFDLLNLARPAASAPWAYVKVAEGCDRHCGFCAIPSFRGRQRSRTVDSVLDEVGALVSSGNLREVVLVAQDLASFGLDRSPRADGVIPTLRKGRGPRPIVELVGAVAERVAWIRLLYLYPSSLDDELIEAVLATRVPYFDLSLQHVSRPLLASMRRPGEGDRFLERIDRIRSAAPDAAFRSSFIVGYPGETEADHDLLLEWLTEARLDWAGFFPFSKEKGTPAADMDGQVSADLMVERLRECSELQDAITASHRDELIGQRVQVLVVSPGEGRSHREAPDIDGLVHVPDDLEVGSFAEVVVTASDGPDLVSCLAADQDKDASRPAAQSEAGDLVR